ncbi:hypothetical protein JJB09_14490 [Rhizobium sp. KVB221]|uniref:DUF6455 domain-containing protein n=1 Tax=Rhizobium setariae TaxID=2801340 RepID=A0A936YUK1_9HYPH|nr:DUF6455 family protein [Rhizobium setariae]MBL0373242.1 hypothetical protein [Rhizobium setariae]
MSLATSLQHCSTNVSRWWNARTARARDLRELYSLSAREIELLSADIGLTRYQFEKLVVAGPHATDELDRMMAALGIDKTTGLTPRVAEMRDLRATCATCDAKKICRARLADGTAASSMRSFCPNSEELVEMASQETMHAA